MCSYYEKQYAYVIIYTEAEIVYGRAVVPQRHVNISRVCLFIWQAIVYVFRMTY